MDFSQPVNQGSSISVGQIQAALGDSPLALYAQDIADFGTQYHVDPALFVTIAKFESDFGRSANSSIYNPSTGTGSFNWGSIGCLAGEWGQIGCVPGAGGHSWGQYATPQAGIEAVYRLIANEYYPRGQQTIGQILFGVGGDRNHDGQAGTAYAPPSDNPQGYFDNFLGYWDSLLRLPGQILPQPTPAPITLHPPTSVGATATATAQPFPIALPAIGLPQPITDITTAVAAIPTAITTAITSIERFFWILVGVLLMLAGLLLLVESSKEVREGERTAAIASL